MPSDDTGLLQQSNQERNEESRFLPSLFMMMALPQWFTGAGI